MCDCVFPKDLATVKVSLYQCPSWLSYKEVLMLQMSPSGACVVSSTISTAQFDLLFLRHLIIG